ncbi:BsuBI/PstI family type II restriction endonuclease [Nocardioides hankookensis]|uniref:BsuBI/PstI family type II restriction endonuclease n=1 Tax=Nocardioides hankookensis TaxID=443157 RepID=A0ABW1LN01_9ACTN
MRPAIGRDLATERLAAIFPRAAFDTVMSNPLAGQAVAAMIYVDAIATDDPADTIWARPSTVTWMSEDTFAHNDPAERAAWRSAAAGAGARKAVAELLESWGLPFTPAYADNSRETIRDETFRKWREAGALRKRSGVPTSSPRPVWALEPEFADLFDPGLTGAALDAAIVDWREAKLSPGAKLKAAFATYEETSDSAITVTLPGGNTRTLEPGIASLILKGVIEQWAPARLAKPVVVSISEPGEKLFTGDNDLLKYLGISINTSELLPDAVLADLGSDPVEFWIVEAVNTDGPIDDARKTQLLTWAQKQKIEVADCRFLTAFRSRNDAAARRRLKDLASDTYAWYADEPTHELSWHQVNAAE